MAFSRVQVGTTHLAQYRIQLTVEISDTRPVYPEPLPSARYTSCHPQADSYRAADLYLSTIYAQIAVFMSFTKSLFLRIARP